MAVEAVEQWRYDPTRLSGVPVPATAVTFLLAFGVDE